MVSRDARQMSASHAALADLLAGFVSPIIAKSIITRALRQQDLDAKNLDAADLRTLAPRLEAAVKLFVEPQHLAAFRAGLDSMLGDRPQRETVVLSIKTERDLADALGATRRLCQTWRLRPLTQQKIATVVSELARNIVSYTPGGTVELIPIDSEPPGLLVRASDSGSGIANLEQIMAGRYRSKTGLGKGLLGSQRLAHRFDVRSGRGGTVIEAELRF
jgi:serine/threonine-protein kinase RsbT